MPAEQDIRQPYNRRDILAVCSTRTSDIQHEHQVSTQQIVLIPVPKMQNASYYSRNQNKRKWTRRLLYQSRTTPSGISRSPFGGQEEQPGRASHSELSFLTLQVQALAGKRRRPYQMTDESCTAPCRCYRHCLFKCLL